MRPRLQRGYLRLKQRPRAALIYWTLAAAWAASGCGYRVVGRANTLPAGAHTIAIPAFTNRTTTYRIEQIFTEAVAREFIARTKYRVVPEADGADLVLQGEVTNIASGAFAFNGSWTNSNAVSGGTGGISFADFLLGYGLNQSSVFNHSFGEAPVSYTHLTLPTICSV